MTSVPSNFIGSIPEHYDAGLGPHIFSGFASDIAGRAARHAPRRVLEIAAGTGIVTRELRDRLPKDSALVATDLNPPMLEWAKKKFTPGEAIEFKAADAQALPFEDGAFDAAVCQFGVMFFPDKQKSYRETFRVLAPGGRYLFNVWDSMQHNAFGKLAFETIGSFFAGEPPAFYKTPFGFYSIDPIKEGLLAAGFSDIAINVVKLPNTMADADLFARGLVNGNPVVEEIRARAATDPATVQAEVASVLRRQFGGGRGKFTLQAIVFEARKPA